MPTQRTPEMEECIINCQECYRVCLETKNYCLELGGMHAEPNHIKTLGDCLEMCATSAHFMLKNSELHPAVCGVCAEACEKCAKSCEMMSEDNQMKKCAEVCRACALSCERMAGVEM